ARVLPACSGRARRPRWSGGKTGLAPAPPRRLVHVRRPEGVGGGGQVGPPAPRHEKARLAAGLLHLRVSRPLRTRSAASTRSCATAPDTRRCPACARSGP